MDNRAILPPVEPEKPAVIADTANTSANQPKATAQEKDKATDEVLENTEPNEEELKDTQPVIKQPAQFMVVSRAYFYTEPDEKTRRAAYIIPSNNTVVTAMDEKDGFIYIIFDNQVTKTSGWLRKRDLQPLSD
jgi:serine/threonine-protein kinase